MRIRHPGQPAPGGPTFAGRASFRTARDGVTSPIPGTAPAPSNGRHRLTSLKTSEMNSFSSPRSARSTNSFCGNQLSDPTQYYFAPCLIRGRSNCGIVAMIRIFALRCGKYRGFDSGGGILPVKMRNPRCRLTPEADNGWDHGMSFCAKNGDAPTSSCLPAPLKYPALA